MKHLLTRLRRDVDYKHAYVGCEITDPAASIFVGYRGSLDGIKGYMG